MILLLSFQILMKVRDESSPSMKFFGEEQQKYILQKLLSVTIQ